MFISNLYSALYPIIFSTAIFGLSTIYPKTHNKITILKSYQSLKIINLLHLSGFTYSIYYAIGEVKQNQLKPNYASGVAKIGIIFQLLAQISVTYIIYFINVTQSGRIISCLRNLVKIDRIFYNLGETIPYQKHFIYEICIMGIWLLIMFGRGCVTYAFMKRIIFDGDNKSNFVFVWPSVVTFLLQNNFVFFVKLLHERFGLVNKILGKIIGSNSNDQLEINQLKNRLKKVELLMHIHDILTDLGNTINLCFMLQIVACFAGLFLNVVFTVFYLYYESLILKNRAAAMVWLIWTTTTIVEIFYVTITCHLTSKESKNSGVTIHKVLLHETDPIIKRKLMIFSEQVAHRPLEFTGCGLFPIDATLIFTITGAAATYLLIMLQFQEGVEAQCTYNTYH